MIHDQDLLSDRNIDFVENFLQKLIENGITKIEFLYINLKY